MAANLIQQFFNAINFKKKIERKDTAMQHTYACDNEENNEGVGHRDD